MGRAKSNAEYGGYIAEVARTRELQQDEAFGQLKANTHRVELMSTKTRTKDWQDRVPVSTVIGDTGCTNSTIPESIFKE
jgi:hypothetical protein